jgi:hypothetical protein
MRATVAGKQTPLSTSKISTLHKAQNFLCDAGRVLNRAQSGFLPLDATP